MDLVIGSHAEIPVPDFRIQFFKERFGVSCLKTVVGDIVFFILVIDAVGAVVLLILFFIG